MIKDKYLIKNQTKDWRKPHRGAKAVDTSCCNHGSCVYCSRGRQVKNRRLKEKADYKDDF